jgi:hypothetical protein
MARPGEFLQPERAAVRLRPTRLAELLGMLAEITDQTSHVFRDEPADGSA